MFGFDKLITPKIITFLYIITMLLFLAAGVISFFSGKVGVALLCVLVAVFCRVFFEGIMIAFKNNEYLRRITEALEADRKNPL
ncbi:DUF4282 domain-containing protein [Pectobacterium carotovorum subsp. carotovorum]|uniref:DUF4282 domain-containing protein n=1 Tax=Pectobacterium carotovorum TaxID=554 RepID=UPI001373922C|nr:DUF4282 domain-containing protein [Pectobacterium carotovorum]QHP55002.1 DUF4282 domain-containing protein [Pectobacterium carotovorum subsp. carotovorum]